VPRVIKDLQSMYQLTEREREMWTHIFDYWWKHGMSPTIDELAKLSSLDRSSVARRVRNMRRKGYIDWPDGTKRAMRCYPILSEGMTADYPDDPAGRRAGYKRDGVA
jgi:SOS-response transcriptional repressor LexA